MEKISEVVTSTNPQLPLTVRLALLESNQVRSDQRASERIRLRHMPASEWMEVPL